MGDEAAKFQKRVATLMTYKKGNLYSDCISYIGKKIHFVILCNQRLQGACLEDR